MRDERHAQGNRKHIFAVNGSVDFLDIVRDLFQGEQYNVTTTNFVPNTFAQIQALDPSLLIIDLVVGQRAGWELLERVGNDASVSGIPVIVVSTTASYLEAVQEDPARYGGQRFLRKPFDLEDMLQAVEELIGPA